MRYVLKILAILAIFASGPAAADETVTTYYPSGRMKDKFSLDKHNRPHGVFETFYDTVDPGTGRQPQKGKAIFTNGLLNGLYTRYYPNGQMQVTTHYKHGKLSSNYFEYTPTGNVFECSLYRDGKLTYSQIPRPVIEPPGKPAPRAVTEEDVLAEMNAVGSDEPGFAGEVPEVPKSVKKPEPPKKTALQAKPRKPASDFPDDDEEEEEEEKTAVIVPPPVRERVEILLASYGSGGQRVDVTEKVQRAYRMHALDSLKPYNKTFGDPSPGWRKMLQIRYKREDGTEHFTEYSEEAPLIIPPPEKK